MDNERSVDVKLIVRSEEQKVLINVCDYPIVCPSCKNYFSDLYHSKGSRYGYLGARHCDCGAKVHLSDSDNVVDYVKCFTSKNDARADKTIVVDFYKEFQLRTSDFEKLKKRLNYDIFEKHFNEEIYLSDLIKAIEAEYKIKASPIESKIPLLLVVKKWMGLLEALRK